MIRVFLAFTLLLFVSSDAWADPRVDAALERLRSAAPGKPRLDAAAEVIALPPDAAPALIAKLQGRAWQSTDAERREVLVRFKASVPDAKGRFQNPGRPPVGGWKEPEWLTELANQPDATPAVLEDLETVAIIRALAASKREDSADALLALAFDPTGMVFRDEVGRLLREMSPYSLATLLRASGERQKFEGSYARYSTYQLDRLDKGRPSYALEAAPNDEIEAAMLRALGEVRHPDAVTAVLDRSNSPSHTVRRAARGAWNAYVTGPEPPPAPKAKRKLPGGTLTEEEMPLYLTYRELAKQELTRRLTEMNEGTAPDPKLDAEALTKIYFDRLDTQRASLWDEQIGEAKKLAAEGKWDEVGTIYDRILTDDPLYARRGDMVDGYMQIGKIQLEKKSWDAAVLAFHKARTIDPTGPRASEAEGQLFLARAIRSESTGRSGDDDLARAVHADPRLEGARVAATREARARVKSSRGWMLWTGIGAALVAIGFGAAAVVLRRRAV